MGWLLVTFDLPVGTKSERRIHSRFRKDLIRDGYNRLQWSVYARPCPTMERFNTHLRRLKQFAPFTGEVRGLFITETQWQKMEIFRGNTKPPPENQPEQLLLFG